MNLGTKFCARRIVALATVVLSLAAGSGCQELNGRSGAISPHAITDFGVDGYGYRWQPSADDQGHRTKSLWDGQPVAEGVVSVSDSSTAQSGNSRQVAAVLGSRAQQDQASCVTILGPLGGYIQPGVALRIRSDGNRARAITVTNNILWGSRHGFNVHLADSGAAGAEQMHQISGYFPSGFATSYLDVPPPPWRLCARVTGRQLQTKVWAPARSPEPTYADPKFATTVTVPPEWVYPGQPGFYVGHLATGEHTALAIGHLERARVVRPRVHRSMDEPDRRRGGGGW